MLSRIYGIENDASQLSEMCLPCAVGRTGEGKAFMFDLAVLPHLDVVQILCDLLRLMDDRYDLLKLADVRNIVEYDAK